MTWKLEGDLRSVEVCWRTEDWTGRKPSVRRYAEEFSHVSRGFNTEVRESCAERDILNLLAVI